MSETLYERLTASKKYADVCPDTVRRLCDECASRYKKPKDAEKAVREKLHGITGAFLTEGELRACEAAVREYAQTPTDAALERILRCHASTRERLPLARTDAIFDRLTALTGTPRRVLDLACGIDPVYLAARGQAVTGVDISGRAVELIRRFARETGAPAEAVCGDLLCEDAFPAERFDLALLFKALPLIERQRAGEGQRLLERIPAACIAVSFPTRSLSGRDVGMEKNYMTMMEAMLPEDRVLSAQFTEGNELFCLLKER